MVVRLSAAEACARTIRELNLTTPAGKPLSEKESKLSERVAKEYLFDRSLRISKGIARRHRYRGGATQ